MADSAFDRARPSYRFRPQPEVEDLVPDTPHDAIGRYALLLRAWEDLTRRQAAYETELKTLQAMGDKLATEWADLAAERSACLDALQALTMPHAEVIERCWDLFKAHLWFLVQTGARSQVRETTPYSIRTLSEPLTRHPRLTE